MSERKARGTCRRNVGADRTRDPRRVLTLKVFSSMVLSQRTQSPQASGAEEGVTLQKGGGAGFHSRMAMGSQEGRVRATALHTRYHYFSPILLPSSCAGVTAHFSRLLSGTLPDRLQADAGSDVGAEEVTGSLICPEVTRHKHSPTPTRVPGARTPAAIDFFIY